MAKKARKSAALKHSRSSKGARAASVAGTVVGALAGSRATGGKLGGALGGGILGGHLASMAHGAASPHPNQRNAKTGVRAHRTRSPKL